MDIELQQYNKNNAQLELSISDLKLKVKAAEKEVDREKEKVKSSLAVVRRFKVDISECAQHIQDPKVLKVGNYLFSLMSKNQKADKFLHNSLK